MFRRARLAVRPNVRPAGRGAGGAADAEPQGSPAASREEAAAAENQPSGRRADSDEKTNSSNDAGEATKPTDMPTQRRKRISTMPNLVKPRAGPSSDLHSASKPQRRASQAPDGGAPLQKDSPPSEKSHGESSSKSPMLPEKKTPVPQVPQFSPLKKPVNKEQTVATQKNDDPLQKNIPSPLKERPTQETSVTQEEKLPPKPSPVKEKRICSDRERILKARKLREMLKEELKKERMKQMKHRPPIIEGCSPPDRSKMTMRDLIYYLPENNPMKSSLAEERRTEKNSALGQMKEQEEKSTPDHEEEDEEEAENGEESQDGPLLVPRVKVAEDGSIILDEESLTVEVLRTKGPCVVEENDPIFERGSTTTYSSFRKSFYTKPWSNKETDMFFLAISMVGTDFSLIGRLFPHRARAEIKNKFKREEKANGWRIDKAFKEKRPFDFELFAQLLEKVLADEEKRRQKNVKSQKPKEKKPLRPRKKPKAKVANTETTDNEDDFQEARISDAETEADTVTAEKENKGSLSTSEEPEEQVSLEPASVNKKRKRKRKDDLEQEVENHPELAVPSKIAEEGKSSKKTGKKIVNDTNTTGRTVCREELGSVIEEEEEDDLPAEEEERSQSFLPMDDITERESDVNLSGFQGSSDVKLVTESTELGSLDIAGGVSQEIQLSEFPVSRTRSKERQPEEARETTNVDTHGLHKPEEKQNASEGGSQSQIMKTEKPAERRRLQKPKPNIMKFSGKKEAVNREKEAVNHEKMEAETSSPKLVNTTEQCSEQDGGVNRNEITEAETMDLGTKSEEPEKTVFAVARIRGNRQRFKPNLTGASGRKENKNSAEDGKTSHPESKEENEKSTDQSNSLDVTSGEAAEKDDKVLEMVSQSNETAGSQEDSKQSVLKPAPLKRGRVQKPKPNLGRAVAWKKDHRHEKDPEEEKVEGGGAEEHVIHHVNESNDSCHKNDMAGAPKTSPQKLKAVENEKGSSDVLKDVSDFSTGESGPENQEDKTVTSSVRLLRSRFHRPKPNFRTASRKEVMDINKGVSQDTNKKESSMQSTHECCILPDIDKAENCGVLQSLESLGKEKSVSSQDVSESSSFKSPDTLSGSEYGKLEACLPVDNQNETSSTSAGINRKITTEDESKQTPLQPVQLVRSRFQKYKPNLGKDVGREQLQIPENNEDKKSEADDVEVQKPESACNVSAIGENEAALHQANVLSNEEQPQQELPQVPCISENVLCEQSRSNEKLSSVEDSKQCDTKPSQQARVSFRSPKPNLTRAHRKRGHSEEDRNRRDEDNAETRNAEEHSLEKTGVSMQNSSNIEDAASFTEATRKHHFPDSVEEPSCKRIRQNSSFQSPEISLESESQEEQEDSQQKESDSQTRRQSGRSSKQIALPKHGLELRTGSSSASECGADCCEKENQRQEVKLSVTRGKSMKAAHRKKPVKEQRSSKTNSLVTLRASQEDEEEADDFEPDDEDECFALEEVNKAPVFVPVGLRSPKPIPVQIEETMEELDISVNIPDVPVATDVESPSHVCVQPVIQKEEKGNTLPSETTVHENPEVDKGVSDGSTEAAMTLLAMGDPTFQLKASTEEWTCMLPAQDELNVANSLVTHGDSEQNRAPNQHVVSSATSAKDPCKDGSNINVENQSTDAGTAVEEYFEKNATDTSNSSLPIVSSMRPKRCELQESNPNTGVLKSNESVIQKPLNTNVVTEQLVCDGSESTDLRGTTETQKAEQVRVGPTSRDTSVLQNFATSMELVKQMDNKESTREEMKDVCGTSGNLSPECEKSHLGLEDYLDESSVDRPALQNPCPAKDSQCAVSFPQNETHARDCEQQLTSSTEETSASDDHRCPEEEQTFILTLVEILADSEEFDTSALQEQTSEPLLPAPILISPVKSSGTSLTEVESTGSSTPAADELGECSNSSMETKRQQSASVEPVLNSVRTAQKRSAAELAENDFPPVKKSISAAVEGNVESPCQGYSSNSTNTHTRTSGNPFQKAGASAKKTALTSALLSESISPADERSQCETSENLGKASFLNLASSQEEEVTSRSTFSRKTEISAQGKLGDVHEAAQLERTESLTESSKTPLLRKSSSETAEEMQRKRGKIASPQTGTTKQSPKKSTPSNKDDRESCSVPSGSTSSFVENDNVTTDAVVTVPNKEPSEKPPHSAEDQENEEEPTKISEYFFSDIFMEVDDPE
ncbi:transcription factor TFIIIB component B'' homolog [Numida meleagris]|uniref:transcription factor TFIIIB component B'' homolog n=1 Tax=Numida meleagris TaxID=8996 RepID=UPI000B3DD048|nr:transcription factor TFIIIB component B'' homolog [Numida meleagris]XP_021236303.1 transcription factor TFIIIB component B'' homolog [Numida meleagris]XP_021236304.1 transcription factor TFIIIB component B'' homolog [Numida meleagris]